MALKMGQPQGQYVAFTREINKRWQIPTVVLFKTATDRVTLSFVHRRPNRRNPDRDVLGSVSLIREINATNPHRAHLDILAELSLPERLQWMNSHGKARNFDGLLDAWLDALDTEELNRRFYQELFQWFERVKKEAIFPVGQMAEMQKEEHVILLITRLLFVWFIKEKELVAEDLFVENRVSMLLADYDRDSGDSYYRAVLQNLFFATLNTKVRDRRFSHHNNADLSNPSVYRYRDEMADPDRLLALFRKTPFINGGLFDCLDSFDGTRAGGMLVDCFTDNASQRAGYSIPNRLFFGSGGLITLLNRYKFTVEENTPAEQEVALDPELLGKVFENLLAAYNPETRTTARKQTGSYYTPRPVVDYMVDEALVATLVQKVQPNDSDADFWQERLRYLLNYDDAFADAEELFTAAEREGVVRAIAKTKVLDPAVGSGAFPMGILHKLTLALRRLDPKNELWENLQKEMASQRPASAFDVTDQSERGDELQNISDTFERYRDSDFGRKLYLVQNCIYGVDIQPIATQIAKLRFFISLAIDQEPTEDANDDYGIKPLPNLETRFVAADSLLPLRNAQGILTSERARKLQKELRVNREWYFHANTPVLKQRLRDVDELLRKDLGTELKQIGLELGDADKIASWDPYDQNAPAADWFDAEYMFGVADGFDVVIGNPPYIQLQKDGGKLRRLYKDAGFATFASTGDIYQLFYERGCQLLAPGLGLLSYITSNSWLKAAYGKSTRRYFAERHTTLRLLEMGKDVFENAIVDACILIARSGKSNATSKAVDMDRLPPDTHFPPAEILWGKLRPQGERPWSALSAIEQSIMDKMEAVGTPLKEWDISIYRGVLTGYNKAFIIDNETKAALIAEDAKSAEILKPVLRGRDIKRYQAQWSGLWLITTFPSLHLDIANYPAIKRHLLSHDKERLEQTGKTLPDGSKSRKKTPHQWFELQDTCAYHEEFTNEKLVWIELVEHGRFAYDDSGLYCEATSFMMTGRCVKYLCAVLNAKLIRWFLQQTAPTSGMGTLRWKKVYIETIPIPKVSVTSQGSLIRLINEILSAKAVNGAADTSELEAEINQQVYKLYELTYAEIDTIENSAK